MEVKKMQRDVMVALLVIAFLGYGADVLAKNCRNSQPCGNSCISWSKTCRIGSGSETVTHHPKRQTATSASSDTTPLSCSLYFVKTDGAEVHADASVTSEVLETLKLGDKVQVCEKRAGWARLPGKNYKWVSYDALSETNPL
jgi:hypothetical protein